MPMDAQRLPQGVREGSTEIQVTGRAVLTVNLDQKMTHKPEDSSLTLSELIKQQQEGLGLADMALAEAIGYSNAAVIRLIKTGQMRLPINKARLLAQALEVEPSMVMKVLLREISPDALKSIEDCMGPLHLSPGERRLVMALRRSAGGRETAPILFDGEAVVTVVAVGTIASQAAVT